MPKKIILFAGQSGVSAGKCLRRLGTRLKRKATILSLEDQMEIVSGKSFRKQILDACIPEQYELWQEGFDELVRKLQETSGNDLVLVSFHAVYKHPREREIFSPVDPRRFLELNGRAKAVVVLIDDIFDVYSRLLQDGEIYDEAKMLSAPESLFSAIGNLLQILEWRQLEITTSRMIARLLRIPMFMIATKHNVTTLAKIVSERLDRLRLLYLSHPITSVRKEAISYPEFPAEVNNFASKLRQYKNVVLFEPTTIDEYKRFRKSADGMLTPDLVMRWPLSSGEKDRIAPPPPGVPRPNWCLDPNAEYAALRGPHKQALDQLLKLLENSIEAQVNSRDFTLVEQASSGVVAYRPYYPDILSGGSWQELSHNHDLYEHEASKKRRCLVLSTEEDYCRNRVRRFFTRLLVNLDNPSKAAESKIEDLCNSFLADSNIVEGFCQDTTLPGTIELVRTKIEGCLPGNYIFRASVNKGPLTGTEKAKQRANRNAGYGVVCKETLADDISELVVKGGTYCCRLESTDYLQREADGLLRNCFDIK